MSDEIRVGPRFFQNDDQYRADLRAQFAPEQIGKLPKPTKADNAKGRCDFCGGYHGLPAVHLDYVGHAAIVERLNAVAPDWTYTLEEPYRDKSGNITGVLGHMTIGGKTLPEVGSVDRAMSDAEAMKQAISDFIRRGAMRFGVALDLWSKEELPGGKDVEAPHIVQYPAGVTDAEREQIRARLQGGEGSDGDEPAGPSPEHIPGVDGPAEQLQAEVDKLNETLATTPEEATALTEAALENVDHLTLLNRATLAYTAEGDTVNGARRKLRQAWGKLHPGKAIPVVADLSDDELRALIEAKAAES